MEFSLKLLSQASKKNLIVHSWRIKNPFPPPPSSSPQKIKEKVSRFCLRKIVFKFVPPIRNKLLELSSSAESIELDKYLRGAGTSE